MKDYILMCGFGGDDFTYDSLCAFHDKDKAEKALEELQTMIDKSNDLGEYDKTWEERYNKYLRKLSDFFLENKYPFIKDLDDKTLIDSLAAPSKAWLKTIKVKE